jgi:hypothetical protein
MKCTYRLISLKKGKLSFFFIFYNIMIIYIYIFITFKLNNDYYYDKLFKYIKYINI